MPASGETLTLDDFERRPGFGSLTAYSETHDNYGVVVKRSGDTWRNLNDDGASIPIPGY